MIILGIETSCDETSAALVENGIKIISNVVASSAEMHVKTGGIIPEQAARQQIKSILPVIQEALGTRFLGTSPYHKVASSAYSLVPKVDAIAVTVGPGLIGSLLVGVETAKTISYFWKKPIVPVNHLVAHLYGNWFDKNPPDFPLVGLVVSGGHTDLVYMKRHREINLLGTTRDDAAGECFDKCSRLLGLPYPGGPSIAKEATKYLSSNSQPLILFPRPMTDEDNLDFSFSGLKTAVLNEVKNKKLSGKDIERYAAEVQEAVVDVLIKKTLSAVGKYKPKSLLLGGGVSANLRLREKFALAIDHLPFTIDFRVPDPKFCTDNAAVVASCAFFNDKPAPWQKVSANPELKITD